jgi:energy-coupling factor transporter transmembrane protein EcfT
MSIFADWDFIRQANNLVILALGLAAIVIVLRGVLKVAWRVIKVILILAAVLIFVGWLLGYIHITFG